MSNRVKLYNKDLQAVINKDLQERVEELEDRIASLRKDIKLKDDTILTVQNQKESIMRTYEGVIQHNDEITRLRHVIRERDESVKKSQDELEKQREEVKKQKEINKRHKTFMNAMTGEVHVRLSESKLKTESHLDSIVSHIKTLCHGSSHQPYEMLKNELDFAKHRHLQRVDMFDEFLKVLETSLGMLTRGHTAAARPVTVFTTGTGVLHDNASNDHDIVKTSRRPSTEELHRKRDYFDKLSKLRLQNPAVKFSPPLGRKHLNDKSSSEIILLAKRANHGPVMPHNGPIAEEHEEVVDSGGKPNERTAGGSPKSQRLILYRHSLNTNRVIMDRGTVLPTLVPVVSPVKIKHADDLIQLPYANNVNHQPSTSSDTQSSGSSNDGRKEIHAQVHVHVPNPNDLEKMFLQGQKPS